MGVTADVYRRPARTGRDQEDQMPTYIAQLSYTEAGMEEITESPARIDEARALAESLGGSMPAWYLTMGPYDALALIELPDDETMARFLLAAGRKGAVTTETVTAIPEDAFRELVGDLPSL